MAFKLWNDQGLWYGEIGVSWGKLGENGFWAIWVETRNKFLINIGLLLLYSSYLKWNFMTSLRWKIDFDC